MHTGLAVITGTEDRQHAYVALTRGTDANLAYVFTISPKRADPVPGPRPAPELARYDQIHAERTGVRAPATPPAAPGDGAGRAGRRAGPRRPAAARPPRPASRPWPTPTTWPCCTRSGPPRPPRPAQQRYRDLLMAALPPDYRREPGHQARWLWRTLRAAELAGLDPAQVLADAIGERDLAGSRDLAAVIDARIRYRLGALVPLPAGPWSAQVPAIADPERRAYVTEIAALMDARKDRIGEHAAEHALPWAVAALGPVPEHPLDRLDWQQRAASIGAWRELSGYHHPADPIGPEPAAAAPDLRAAWHEALAALGPADGPDVRGMPDGTLLHLRDTYPIETAWAPQYVGDELRQVRAAAWNARLAGLRASAEANAAASRGQHDTRRPAAGARRQLPGPARGLPATRDRVRRRHGRPGRLGRRHPRPAPPGRGRRRRTPPPPPRPALPAAALGRTPARHPGPARRAHPDRGAADPGEMGQWIKDLAAAHRTFADTLAERQSLTIPSEDPDYGDLGQAFPPWPGPARDAILQPPKPEIRPSPQVLAARRGPRRRPGGRRLTVARCILGPGGDRDDRHRHHRHGPDRRAAADLGPRQPGPRAGPQPGRRDLRHLDRPGLPRPRPGPGRRRGQRGAAAAGRRERDRRPHLGSPRRARRRTRPGVPGRHARSPRRRRRARRASSGRTSGPSGHTPGQRTTRCSSSCRARA